MFDKTPIQKYETIRRQWRSFMDGEPMTLIDWLSESKEEQDRFYSWFCAQSYDTFGDISYLI